MSWPAIIVLAHLALHLLVSARLHGITSRDEAFRALGMKPPAMQPISFWRRLLWACVVLAVLAWGDFFRAVNP
jgi:hypothetical protein